LFGFGLRSYPPHPDLRPCFACHAYPKREYQDRDEGLNLIRLRSGFSVGEYGSLAIVSYSNTNDITKEHAKGHNVSDNEARQCLNNYLDQMFSSYFRATVLQQCDDGTTLPEVSPISTFRSYPVRLTPIVEIIRPGSWPQELADAMTHEAQRMAGWFWGRDITVEQMAKIDEDETGKWDTSVQVGDTWSEPFDFADDCVFCQTMTDESVWQRVAAFQWQLEKETASLRVTSPDAPAYPHDSLRTGETTDTRPELDFSERVPSREWFTTFYQALDAHLAETPQSMRAVRLTDLPLALQRFLCIRWNHLVYDWFFRDHTDKYAYVNGRYFTVLSECTPLVPSFWGLFG
jgi:hypothetical protein